MLFENILKDDFIKRQNICKNEIKRRGLTGLMIWSRGGGVFDRYADVDYLANHYQQRCYLPDNLPLWSGRSHSVLFITTDSKPILIVSSPEYKNELIMVDDIRYNTNFYDEIFKVIEELEMNNGKIGIIGSDVMTYHHFNQIDNLISNLEFIESDDILSKVKMIKTPREIKSIKEACRIGTKAIDITMSNVEEGKTESQVIAPALEHVFSEGAALYFTVTSSGPYVNSAHSKDFPGYDNSRLLNKGEIFRIDLIIVYEGYICDFGRSTVVGGDLTNKQKEMLDGVTAACEYVIDKIKPGISVKEICEFGDNYLTENNVIISTDYDDSSKIYSAYPPHWGHGIGMTWERPWLVKDEEIIIKENMYLAIEKSLYCPDVGTVSYEQNILVTEKGSEILTKSKKRWY